MANDRTHDLEPVDRGDDPLAELRMGLDERSLGGSQPSRLREHVARDADLADVVQESAELEALQRALVEAEFPADPQREIRDPARVGRRVLVVRLERVGERLDGGDERPLETLVTRGVRDRELRLLCETAEQGELALSEVVPLHERDEAAHAAVDGERRDRVAAAGDGRLPDQGLVVLRLGDVRLPADLQGVDRIRVSGELGRRLR